MSSIDRKVLKITGWEAFDNGNPTLVAIQVARNKIEESGLFDFVGRSRIDGFEMYMVKDYVDRLSKIQKIKKEKENIREKLDFLLEEIKGSIEYITIL